MRKICYFDCFAGASGDMILGALIDLGLDVEYLKQELKKLNLSGYTIETSKVMRSSLSGTLFTVKVNKHQHHHRTLKDILNLINEANLETAVKEKASSMFHHLGEIEASIHQKPLEEVSFHEVGAVDSIIDIVGAAIALHWFKIDEFACSPLNVGRGTVECHHGTLPVPAPATVELLRGIPVYSSGIECELVTPTGALIISSYVKNFGALPAMIIEKVGYGAGQKDLQHFPNLLRIFIGKRNSDIDELQEDETVIIETNIDDMNPENFSYCQEKLFNEGALDIFFSPIIMKKGRPATKITVIAPLELRDKMVELLFQETTTIGLRYYPTWRKKLLRENIMVDTPFGKVEIKVARLGKKIMNAAPEYESCYKIAKEKGIALKEVQHQAMKSFIKWENTHKSS
jgi:uncharacterized protein (TIGR00299 family) protein